MADAAKPKKKREMLTSFSIIYILMIAVVLISWAFNGRPTGALTEDGAQEVVAGATLADFTMASVNGFNDAVAVCLFVMVLGGFLAIVNETNALNVGIKALVKKMHGSELKLIPILMFLFAILGSTYGFCEETVGFYILLAATMMTAGFDPLTGVMMILLGAGVGCLGSTVNPFAVGAAVDALGAEGVDIAVNQGYTIALGLILMVVTWAICSFIVVQYAKKVREDPSKTLMTEEELEAAREAYGNDIEAAGDVALTGKQKAVLWLFGLSFLIMILGFVPWDSLGIYAFADADGNPGWTAFLTGQPLGWWYFAESTTWFLLMAIIIGVVYGFSEHKIVDLFMAGAGDMMSVVLIIAVARGVTDRLLRPVLLPELPDPVDLRHGRRLDADHGAPDGLPGLQPRRHHHGLLRGLRRRQPDHPDLRCHHGRPGARSRAVLDLVQVLPQDRRHPLGGLHHHPLYRHGGYPRIAEACSATSFARE